MTEHKEKTEFQPRLTGDEKRYLFACLLRNPILFLMAKEELPPEVIDPVTDMVLLALWRGAKNAAASRPGGQLPEDGKAARILLELEVGKICELDPVNIRPEHVADLMGIPGTSISAGHQGLIEWIYSLDSAEILEEKGKELLMAYLNERTVLEQFRQLGDRVSAPLVPASLQPFLDKIEKARSRIQGLAAPRPGVPVLDLSGDDTPELYTTGSSFMDRFMDGGQAGGEMYTIMGSTGSCKTLLGCSLFMDGALEQQRLFDEHQGQVPLGHWHYFVYEMPRELKLRLWSHAAKIDINTFLKKQLLSTAEDPATFKKYEYEIHRRMAGRDPMGEKERLADAEARWLKHPNFFVHDYSGAVPGVGGGGIAEIALTLERETREGRPVAGVVIDYAGLVVNRMIESGKLDRDHQYMAINSIGQEVVNRLCARFNCVVWLLHQLHGEMAKRSPTARMHHADAQGARNFANAAWFAFQLGNKDDQSKCITIWCTKTRRTDSTDHPAIVRVDGALMTLTDMDAHYTLSEVDRGRIVPKVFENRVVNPAAATKKSSLLRPGRLDAGA